MKKTLILSMVVLTLIIGCTPQQKQDKTDKPQPITTVEEALQAIKGLDEKYNTSYREEKMNKLTLPADKIQEYLQDLNQTKSRVQPVNEDQARWIKWLFASRKQMLQSQLVFQQAWLGIGKKGRVSDGFACSEYPAIKAETLALEKAYVLGQNSTGVLDSLMTENNQISEAIGINDEKPAMYESRFNKIDVEIQSNIVAMNEFCNKTIQTQYLNYTDRLKKVNVNTSKYRRNEDGN